MLIGYARVSTQHQNLDRQIAALRKTRCATIFTEKASGKSTKGRPELEKAIDALGTGDVLVLAEWDRATRSMTDGLKIIQRVADRGARPQGARPLVSRSDDDARPGHSRLSVRTCTGRARTHRQARGRRPARRQSQGREDGPQT